MLSSWLVRRVVAEDPSMTRPSSLVLTNRHQTCFRHLLTFAPPLSSQQSVLTGSIIFKPVLVMYMITIKTHKFSYAAQQGWSVTYTQEINVVKIVICCTAAVCVCLRTCVCARYVQK